MNVCRPQPPKLFGDKKRFALEVAAIGPGSMAEIHMYLDGLNIDSEDTSVYLPQFQFFLASDAEALSGSARHLKHARHLKDLSPDDVLKLFFKWESDNNFPHFRYENYDLYHDLKVCDLGPTSDHLSMLMVASGAQEYLLALNFEREQKSEGMRCLFASIDSKYLADVLGRCANFLLEHCER